MKYRLTYKTLGDEKKQIVIEATSKFDAILALERKYGKKRVFVTQVEEDNDGQMGTVEKT